MLSQSLNTCIPNGPLDLKSHTESIRNASACSCSDCDSVSCFYIRNRKSTLTCSCNHPKINEECVKYISKDENDLNEVIDYKKSDTDVVSYTKCDLHDNFKNNKLCEQPRAQNITIAYDNSEQENPKAELSAQIMDVPYEEFKCSLSKRNNKRESDDNNNSPVINVNDLIKPDILTRLKEIYKACSCKVCECITDNPFPTDVKAKELCKCTPCDCNECVITQKHQKLDPRPHSGCPCVKCDRKDCRGVVKKSMEVLACDCSPCDCLNCTDTSTKSCNCEPCRCAECMMNTRKPTLPVKSQKKVTQSTCQCKPCQCENCRRVYTTMAANLIQDMSKKFSYSFPKNDTYLNDLIEFNEDEYGHYELIRNSDQLTTHDCDIHTTFVSDQLVPKGYNNFNTIAMMAMYSTNYSKVELNNSKDCKCLGCECLICTSRENEIRNKLSKISVSEFHRDNIVLTSHSKSCDCVACQCEFCSHVQNKLARKLISLEDSCSCSVCDCLMCNKIANRNDDIGITSHWASQERDLPEQVTRDTSCTNTYPLKKGKLLVPSMFESNTYEPSCLKSQLYFGNKNFGQNMETRTELNTEECSSTILRNLKQNNMGCENLKRYEQNIESPVKEIYSNNYLKNNNLHIGNTTSKDFHVPTELNISSNEKDGTLNSIEDHTKEMKTFGSHSIKCNEVTCSSNNPFNNLDKAKNVKIVNDKATTFQETASAISNHSIMSIFKSTSESILCDSVSRTKNITVLNNYKCDKMNLENVNLLNSEANNYNSEQNLDASKTEVTNNKIIESESKQHKNNIVKNKYMYNKMYRRLMKRSQLSKKRRTLPEQTKVNCKNENDGKVNIIENLKVIVDDQNENNLELTIKNKKTVDDFFSSEMNMLKKIKNEVQNIDNEVLTKPWPILQKNFYNMNCPEIRQNKGVCTIPDMELDVKHAVKLISQQKINNYENKGLMTQNIRYDYKYDDATTQTQAKTILVDKETNCSILASAKCLTIKLKINRAKAVLSLEVISYIQPFIPIDLREIYDHLSLERKIISENLRNNMKYLLDLVLSRVMPMTKAHDLSDTFRPVEKISSKIPKINSIESCDGLKADFIEIKRVSNHTLLVRWKLPQKTAYIQGYELQVDGRSVQRILSPTRCMAVLTCLPRCEKLLLTIRTITTMMLSDHYPATTIVYRPYIK